MDTRWDESRSHPQSSGCDLERHKLQANRWELILEIKLRNKFIFFSEIFQAFFVAQT